MMPAFFASVVSFVNKRIDFVRRRRAFVIILAFFLSFSTTGYIGAMFCIIILGWNYKKIKYLFGSLAVSFCVFLFLYNNISMFRARIDQSVRALRHGMNMRLGNVSVYALYSNAVVAHSSLKDNLLFGSGLGSHEISYYKYLGEIIDFNTFGRKLLNTKDANSLFLRLLSETGLFGIAIVCVFIFRFHLWKQKDPTGYLWIVNNAILTVFFVRLARGGHYFDTGLFFFFWLYCFSKLQAKMHPFAAEKKFF